MSEEKRDPETNLRGYTTVSAASLMNTVQAEDKHGETRRVPFTSNALGELPPYDAYLLFRWTAEVYGVMTGRAVRLATIPWQIEAERPNEDRIVQEARDQGDRFREFISRNEKDEDAIALGRAAGIYAKLKMRFSDLFPDLSNLEGVLKRWSREIRFARMDQIQELEDFFANPNPGKTTWSAYAAKWALDSLIFGNGATYIIPDEKRDVPAGIETLPGGTVHPSVGQYVASPERYVQFNWLAGDVVSGGINPLMNGHSWPRKGLLYENEELIYTRLQPFGWSPSGLKPIDSIVCQIFGILRMQGYITSQSDGTQPPEKLVIMPNEQQADPADGVKPALPAEQKERLEEIMNTPVLDVWRRIISAPGTGTPVVLDMTKADMLPSLLMGTNDVTKRALQIALHATAIEFADQDNGGQGRSVAEEQARQLQTMLAPLAVPLKENLTNFIKRYWGHYEFKMQPTRSTSEMLDLVGKAAKSGVYPTNEVRTKFASEAPLADPAADQLPAPAQQQPGEQSLLDGIGDMLQERIDVYDRMVAG